MDIIEILYNTKEDMPLSFHHHFPDDSAPRDTNTKTDKK
jgi:hypothetical protein